MIRIRETQMRVFAAAREAEVTGRLADRFAKEYPDDFRSMGSDRVFAFVSETITAAKKRLIHSEDAVYVLLRLFHEFQPDLGLNPYRRWANSLLDDHSLPAAVRVNMVARKLFALSQGRRIVLNRVETE
jgi:hypothetical protein